jgi:hypothetical protein
MKRILLILLFASSAFAEPTVTSIEPSSAPASGGVFVHIFGSDLMGFALACPSIECANYVKFGDELGGMAVNTSDEIVVLAPAHAPGIVDLTVNVAGKKKIILPAAFTYEAADSSEEAHVLLPVIASNASGAFGSIWQTDASFFNHSDTTIDIHWGDCQPNNTTPALCFSASIQPKTTTHLTTLNEIEIPRGRISDLDISLRVRDLSRQSQTWGTAIPVVRETDFRPIVRLQNVPTDPRFRVTLRTYNYFDTVAPLRTIRIFDETTGELLVTDTLTSLTAFQINSLTDTYPQIRGHDTVRIEVQPNIDPPIPIWAFVSVTNNETQHVTVIAPSP